ncbi:hypothetical protein OK795_10715, partial [Streptococcus pneumoniae]|nr:hypothetical protein [Streptococcus pneumoniae]
ESRGDRRYVRSDTVTGSYTTMPDATPFLETLISVVSEPNGSSTAQQAYEATRDWWDEHSEGPTAAELLDAMFEPADWLSVIDDRNR